MVKHSYESKKGERRLIFRDVEECSVNGRRIVNVIEEFI